MKEIYNMKDFLEAPNLGDQKLQYVLTGHENHIFLYAKNHYHGIDKNVISDLKVLVGHVCSIEPEHVSTENLYHVVYGVWKDWVGEHQRDIFVRELFKGGLRMRETISVADVILDMISDISQVKMKFEDREILFSEKISVDFST